MSQSEAATASPNHTGSQNAEDDSERPRGNSKISGMTLRKSLTKVQDGDVWAKYEKGRKLGSGKSGQCYEGVHKVTKQVFAVKVIRVRNLDENMKARLVDEIEYMTEMDHPNIVKVFESFRGANGDFALVMELLSGGELYEHLLDSEDGRYSESVAARLFEMMCKAVAYIHSKKICHRDLKLENFVFDETSDEAQIKLIDFGLSRRHGLGIKRMKTAVGTPYYVAPEVIQRGKSYDAKCDVWSLGVLLYMMLSGRPPFDAETDRGILSAIRKCRYSFEDPVWAEIGKPVKDLIKRMLVTDPKERIDPTDILMHPWVQAASSAKNRAPVNAVIARNLRNFKSVSALKRTTMEMVALSLNPSQIKGLQVEFEKMDTNKDGVLTLDEFKLALEHKMPEQEIESLFSQLDGDCSGHIECVLDFVWSQLRCCLALCLFFLSLFVSLLSISQFACSTAPVHLWGDFCFRVRCDDADCESLLTLFTLRARYSEFVSAAIACTNYLPESQLRLAFNRLDADNSGAF